MSFSKLFLAVPLCLLAFLATASAQLHVELNKPPTSQLLYSPIVMEVRIVNQSAQRLELKDVNGKSWLRFLIKTASGVYVKPTADFLQPTLVLEPGEAVQFGFDLTPFYCIREVGSYQVRALVKMPDMSGDIATEMVQFSVVKGQKVWAQDLIVAGDKRLCSILSFLVNERMQFYAQIESEDSNLVYVCLPLGGAMIGELPEAMLERGSFWHILFRASPNTYRYFKLNLDGRAIEQTDYAMQAESRPHISLEGGVCKVVGGINADLMRPETLSETQPPEVLRVEVTGYAPREEQQLQQKKKKN